MGLDSDAVTMAEATEILGCSDQHARDEVARGELAASRVGPRGLFVFSRIELERLAARRAGERAMRAAVQRAIEARRARLAGERASIQAGRWYTSRELMQIAAAAADQRDIDRSA